MSRRKVSIIQPSSMGEGVLTDIVIESDQGTAELCKTSVMSTKLFTRREAHLSRSSSLPISAIQRTCRPALLSSARVSEYREESRERTEGKKLRGHCCVAVLAGVTVF